MTEQIDQKHPEDLQRLSGFRLLDDEECKEGIEIMCRAMEGMRNQTLKEGMKEVALRMLVAGK